MFSLVNPEALMQTLDIEDEDVATKLATRLNERLEQEGESYARFLLEEEMPEAAEEAIREGILIHMDDITEDLPVTLTADMFSELKESMEYEFNDHALGYIAAVSRW